MLPPLNCGHSSAGAGGKPPEASAKTTKRAFKKICVGEGVQTLISLNMFGHCLVIGGRFWRNLGGALGAKVTCNRKSGDF